MPDDQDIPPQPETNEAPQKPDAPPVIPLQSEKSEETSLSPKGSAKTYNTTAGDHGIFGIGDNPNISVTNNAGTVTHNNGLNGSDIVNAVIGAYERGRTKGEDAANANNTMASTLRNRFSRKIQEDTAEALEDASPNTDALPENIPQWYSTLNVYDKCFVQAMVIFDGATVPDVISATSKLYEPIQEAMRRYTVAQTAGTAPSSTQSPPKFEAPDDVLLAERMTRTHTKIRRVARENRFYWRDADARGISSFKERVLEFIAQEVHAWTESVFLAQLYTWAENLTDGNEIRAAYAFGAIWWHHSETLQNIANEWSKGEAWFRAAYFLDGAYRVDRSKYGEAANDPSKSPVLWLLQKWVRHARLSGNIQQGYTAALTYTLIGVFSPVVALQGLDALLELPPNAKEVDTDQDGDIQKELFDEELYNAVILGYVDIAASGSIRDVLRHSATRVERLAHRRLQLTDMKSEQRNRYGVQRKINVIAAVHAFYLIAIQSLQQAKDNQWVNYTRTQPLPVPVLFSRNHTRDTLLTGILLPDEQAWRSHILTLLCAAIFERVQDFAFIPLRKWTDIVLKDQSERPDEVRAAYANFLVTLGKMIYDWQRHLTDLESHPPNATTIFKRKVEQWQVEGERKKQPIAGFAKEILDQLPF